MPIAGRIRFVSRQIHNEQGADGEPVRGLRRLFGSTWGESLVGFLLALGFYVALYSSLPIDDTVRFTDDIEAGRYQWEGVHLLMQPIGVLWHQVFGCGASALASQKHLNSFCAAVALVLFFAILRRVGTPRGTRWLLFSIALVSYNLLNLATSGHIKLVCLPFLTWSFLCALAWEFEPEGPRAGRHLRWCGLALGFATLTLISSGATACFLCPALLVAGLRAGRGFRAALRPALVVGGLALGVFAVGFAAVYLSQASGEGPVAFLTGELTEEGVDRFGGWAETLLRACYATVQNFVHLDDLGTLARAHLWGQIPSIGPYLHMMLWEALLAVVFLLALVWLILRAAPAVLRGRPGMLACWSFLFGTLGFAILWNLAESDFYFQLTFPTLTMIALLPRLWLRTGVLAGWLAVALLVNVFQHALPKQLYPYERYRVELSERFGPDDLIIGFVEYSGRQCLNHYLGVLPEEQCLLLDRCVDDGDDELALELRLVRRIDAALDAGGDVVIFRVLERSDWNAPWSKQLSEPGTKERLTAFLEARYRVAAIEPIAEIPCWRVERQDP